MNTFLIVIVSLIIVLFIATFIVITGYIIYNLISIDNEPIVDKENRIFFKKNIHSSCTYALGFRGGVRSFNGLFRKKDLKKFMELNNDKG